MVRQSFSTTNQIWLERRPSLLCIRNRSWKS